MLVIKHVLCTCRHHTYKKTDHKNVVLTEVGPRFEMKCKYDPVETSIPQRVDAGQGALQLPAQAECTHLKWFKLELYLHGDCLTECFKGVMLCHLVWA